MAPKQLDRRQFLQKSAVSGISLGGLASLAACGQDDQKTSVANAASSVRTPIEAPTPLPNDSDITISEVRTYIMDDAIFVKVTTASGHEGWGECDAGSHEVMEAFIHSEHARRVVGKDPFNNEPLFDAMFYRAHDFGPGGALSNSIAGIDIALWDLKGKILDAPVYRLLGGKYRDSMPVYGSYGTGRWRMSKEDAVAQAVKFVRNDFRTVKCRMQIRESHLNPVNDKTLEYVDAIEKEIGDDVELFVDINNGYSAARAIQIGRVLQEQYGHRFFEEPCSDQNHSETAEVVAALDLGVIAGEKEYTLWQVDELIRYANPDYLNPDVIKAGGVTVMDKIAALAQARQKPMILHNTRPTISTAASLHLVAAMPTVGPFFEFPDVDNYPDMIATVKNYLEYGDGEIRIPAGPGLGMEIDEEKVAARALSMKVTTADD